MKAKKGRPVGRPVGSMIRQNILEIINVKKKVYGYKLYQYYIDIFPKVHKRSVYYHLKKGVALKEINSRGSKYEKGRFTWGAVSKRVYYTLGPEANVKGSKIVSDYFKKNK